MGRHIGSLDMEHSDRDGTEVEDSGYDISSIPGSPEIVSYRCRRIDGAVRKSVS